LTKEIASNPISFLTTSRKKISLALLTIISCEPANQHEQPSRALEVREFKQGPYFSKVDFGKPKLAKAEQ
jgi:hypothetical protein